MTKELVSNTIPIKNIIDAKNKIYKFELKSKRKVADDIINHLINNYNV